MEMKKLWHNISVSILSGLIWMLSLLPLRLLYLVSDITWLVMYLCPPLRYRRRIVWKNLKGSFPEKTDRELHGIERRFYRQFLDQIFEMFKSASMGGAWMRRHMRFDGIELIEKEFAKGHSMIMYLGHTGNWEWISSLPLHVPAELGTCCQVYHPLHSSVTDSVMLWLRGQYGAESIALKRVYRRLLEMKKSGKPFIVGMISDQVPLYWDTHYWGTFMNRYTPFMTGSELLAKKMGLTTCYGHLTRERRGHYVVKIVPMFGADENPEENVMTGRYVQLLEDNIRESPHLWLWTHNRWKRTWEGYKSWLMNELKSNRRDSEKE